MRRVHADGVTQIGSEGDDTIIGGANDDRLYGKGGTTIYSAVSGEIICAAGPAAIGWMAAKATTACLAMTGMTY
ncbi:hypothetical protein [Paludibacterium purpuratum]|uniref:hypothetical protein n=1 Tax=Paludibacterium purpuratum TaxID=1144873 RepID=UPI001AADC2FC